MKIVKAEILWTRKCPLNCGYCSMNTGQTNSLSLEEWVEGIFNLKHLGCEFIAFYGAEPLADIKNLGEVIGIAELIGIKTTLITSGCVPKFRYKIIDLISKGLKSLTMSYDIVPLDQSSKTKSQKAVESLLFFQRASGYKNRDTAIVVTLTRQNFRELPATIRRMCEMGIWTFFDFIHPDRGQPGSKVKGNFKDFLFKQEDLNDLKKTLEEVLELKEMGCLCHTSSNFVEEVSHNNFETLRKYNWNCARTKGFPAWITIDCDGFVSACDDFQIRTPNTEKFRITNIENKWELFERSWIYLVEKYCPGCCWNTHIDAHAIKNGELNLNQYIHGDI